MTRPEKIAHAKRLRREGLTYREIGERLGVTGTCAQQWLNSERTRETARRSNAKRNGYKREWEEGKCPECGGRLAQVDRSERCAECHREKERREARERAERFIELREAGYTNIEIERIEVLTPNTVAVALSKGARKYNLEVPRSPYWSRAAA